MIVSDLHHTGKMPNSDTDPRRDSPSPGFSPLLLILAATFFLYLPCLRYGFVYDDQVQIVTNPRIASWSYLPAYFQHHVWIQISTTGSYYRPLFLLWLRINHVLWGMNPVGWHATSLVLHLVAVALAYLLLRRTIPDPLVVVVATAVFALHPAHIESTAWISGSTDPLMAIPLIGSLLCWLRYRQHKRVTLLIASLLLFVAALMVKESAAITPLLIFVYGYVRSSEDSQCSRLRQAIRSCAPYFALLLAYVAVRRHILYSEIEPALRPLYTAILNLPAMAWFYFRHLLWPARLSVMYDFDLTRSHSAMLIAATLLVSIATLAIFFAFRRSPALLSAWAWIVFPIAAAIAGTPQFDPHDYVHDRYLYLPVLGLGILFAAALRALRCGQSHLFGQPASRAIAALIVLGAMAYGTESQLFPWTNNLTLFSHAVQVAPTNPMSYEHLAFEMYKRGDLVSAMNLYKKAIALDPQDWHANFGLAVLYYRSEQWAPADFYCDRANQITPDANNVCYQFQTVARMKLGALHAAEIPIRYAIAHWPQVTGQHLLLGRVFVEEGDKPAAAEEFQNELRIDPKSTEAQNALAQLQP